VGVWAKNVVEIDDDEDEGHQKTPKTVGRARTEAVDEVRILSCPASVRTGCTRCADHAVVSCANSETSCALQDAIRELVQDNNCTASDRDESE
jgi:hypothetical protein